MANTTWIPVEYELPKESGYYLVAFKDVDPFVFDDGCVEDSSYVANIYYNADQMIFSDEQDWYWNMLRPTVPNGSSIITHWMPLPDLPFEKVVKVEK